MRSEPAVDGAMGEAEMRCSLKDGDEGLERIYAEGDHMLLVELGLDLAAAVAEGHARDDNAGWPTTAPSAERGEA